MLHASALASGLPPQTEASRERRPLGQSLRCCAEVKSKPTASIISANSNSITVSVWTAREGIAGDCARSRFAIRVQRLLWLVPPSRTKATLAPSLVATTEIRLYADGEPSPASCEDHDAGNDKHSAANRDSSNESRSDSHANIPLRMRITPHANAKPRQNVMELPLMRTNSVRRTMGAFAQTAIDLLYALAHARTGSRGFPDRAADDHVSAPARNRSRAVRTSWPFLHRQYRIPLSRKTMNRRPLRSGHVRAPGEVKTPSRPATAAAGHSTTPSRP